MPTVLITGAGRGIGREFVRQYRDQGWAVIATLRCAEHARELSDAGARAHMLDLLQPQDIASLAEELRDEAIDVLICNAGVYEGLNTKLDEIDADLLLRTLQVNTMAPILLAKAFRPHLKRGQQKKLIAITSLLGSVGNNRFPGHIAYRASKAALNAAWSGLALEEPELIAALLRPGRVSTRMLNFKGELSPEQSVSGMCKVIAGLTSSASGLQFDYQGQTVPW
jgi:NAD(P)-dependent dehydrogenase (short-subunit alcohol dehydrogenase family)